MSTFYGGEQLISITEIYTDSSSNDPFYTVPSGYYAVVEYSMVKNADSGSINAYATATSEFNRYYSDLLGNTTIATRKDTIYIGSGDTFGFNHQSVNAVAKAIIKLYKKP